MSYRMTPERFEALAGSHKVAETIQEDIDLIEVLIRADGLSNIDRMRFMKIRQALIMAQSSVPAMLELKWEIEDLRNEQRAEKARQN